MPLPWALLKSYYLPLLAFALMCTLIALTPAQNLIPHSRTPLEWVAHDLGHAINSVWVGFGLLLLVVPALFSRFKGKGANLWGWRALDAIALDFLCVDAMGKSVFTGLGRPQNPEHPGFPSGHATMAFLMAWLVWQRFPKLGPLWFLMASLIAWSRIQSHAHFPYQVIFGAVLGCALGALIMRLQGGVFLPRIWMLARPSRSLQPEA